MRWKLFQISWNGLIPFKCPEVIVVWLLVLEIAHQTAAGIQLPDLYWNSTNPIFGKDDRRNHVVSVWLKDRLNIVCPYYDNAQSEQISRDAFEYSIIYMVDEWGYKSCNVGPNARTMIRCDSPLVDSRPLSITFRQLSPNPGAPDYQPGSVYYFISSSGGTRDSILQRSGGLCKDKHMKLQIEVHGYRPRVQNANDAATRLGNSNRVLSNHSKHRLASTSGQEQLSSNTPRTMTNQKPNLNSNHGNFYTGDFTVTQQSSLPQPQPNPGRYPNSQDPVINSNRVVHMPVADSPKTSSSGFDMSNKNNLTPDNSNNNFPSQYFVSNNINLERATLPSRINSDNSNNNNNDMYNGAQITSRDNPDVQIGYDQSDPSISSHQQLNSAKSNISSKFDQVLILALSSVSVIHLLNRN